MLLKNDRLIKALLHQPVDMTPVWLMRQAGRYLQEYREIRKKAKDFLVMCKTPELACEVTLQPLRRFPLDAAIIFSDILTIPDAMGLSLYFEEGEGPRFKNPIQSINDIEKLAVPDIEKLSYVMDAIKLTKKELNNSVPLIGFSGSPWTLATYMIEGGSSKNFSKIKKFLFEHPTHLHQILKILADSVIAYLNEQINVGADVVMIFDTWGGILTPRDYQLFSLDYMSYIIKNLNRQKGEQKIPVILFTKGGANWLEMMADSGADALGIDWSINIGDAKKRVGNKVALQGNMDPSILYASPERIREEVKNILTDYGNQPGHIFNLGHGMLPNVPSENVAALVEAVHELSSKAI